MKTIISIISILALFSNMALAGKTVPRQKIQFNGLTTKSAPKELGLLDFNKMKEQKEFDLFDPYNKDIKTHFYCIPFTFITDSYADPSATAVKVTAIDGYQVTIKLVDVKKINLYLAYKDQDGYLSVDRMGPLRIIENREGKLNKELVTKIGVNWVWQIKAFEFIK